MLCKIVGKGNVMPPSKVAKCTMDRELRGQSGVSNVFQGVGQVTFPSWYVVELKVYIILKNTSKYFKRWYLIQNYLACFWQSDYDSFEHNDHSKIHCSSNVYFDGASLTIWDLELCCGAQKSSKSLKILHKVLCVMALCQRDPLSF
jgi:hypothetical protein